MIVGSHVDSVPAGGWLDGALGVFTAVEALRSQAEKGTPPVGLRLVDWADEEGARFGRSLFGSSCCAGTLDPDEVRDLRDRDGERLEDVLARYDVELDRARESGARAEGRARVHRGPHRAGAGAGEHGRARRDGARHVRRRAPPGRVHGRDRARRRHADADAARQLHGHGPGRARDPRGRACPRGRRLHGWRSHERAGRRDRGAGPHGDAARPAPPRPGRAGGDAVRGPRGLRAGRGRPRLRVGAPAPLVDPADPVRRPPDRLRAAGGAGRGRQGHRDPERPAPRCRRDGAPDPDRDAVLLVLAAGLAHQGGGHPRGRPPGDDRRLRPHGRGHARVRRRGRPAAARVVSGSDHW